VSTHVHPVYDRVRHDLTAVLDAGRLGQAEASELLGALGRGERPTPPDGTGDVLHRLAWLMFSRAPQLDPRYMALSPMWLGFLSTGQRSFAELIDDLTKVEVANPGRETDSLERLLTTHGAALTDLLAAHVGQSGGAEARMQAMMDTMLAKTREHALAGRWESVPLPGPDAPAVRTALRALPVDKAVAIYDAWQRAEAAAQQEDWDKAIAETTEAARHSDHLFETFVRRARYRFASGDRIAAGADLERALFLYQGSAAAHAMRAELRVLIRDMTGSLQDWEAAVRAAPDHVPYRMGRAFTRLAMGQIDAAFEDFHKAVELAPDDTTPLYNRADAWVRKGDLAAAVADYDRVLQLAPDDIKARMNRATVQQMRRDFDAAIADLDVVLDQRPMNAMAYAKRASSELGRNRPWPAWCDAATCLAVAEPDWEHRATLERFLSSAHQRLDGSEHARFRVEDVAERFDRLRAKATGTEILQLAAVLDQHLPAEHLGLHLLRGAAWLDYGRWSEAANAYQDALAVDERSAAAWLGRGRALLHLVRIDEALAALQRARGLAYDLDEAATFELHLARGRAQGSRGLLAEAVTAFDEALALRPTRADVWFYKGVHLDLLGDRPGALEAYSRSLDHDSAFAPAWFNRACEHAVLGHREEALADLTRAISLDPQWGPAAAKDSYFESLWADPGFLAVVGG
jgi:tetratricopeptide (TPR) repeat protein